MSQMRGGDASNQFSRPAGNRRSHSRSHSPQDRYLSTTAPSPPGFLGAARSHTRLAAAQTTILCTVSIARQVCSKGPASYEPGLNFRYFGNYYACMTPANELLSASRGEPNRRHFTLILPQGGKPNILIAKSDT